MGRVSGQGRGRNLRRRLAALSRVCVAGERLRAADDRRLESHIANPRDIPALVKALRATRFTAIPGVNTLFNALLNNKDFAGLDFSQLHLTIGGGMAVQRAVAERWQSVTGKPLIEAYGLTETSPAAIANPLNIDAFNGAIGLPMPSTDIVIRDDEGRDLKLGETGELCIKGPQVMAGYWNRPDETEKVMTADGFLRTGDIARVDERGYVYVVDRKKDMINVSGFNVYPNEIEDVAMSHPGVLEAARSASQTRGPERRSSSWSCEKTPR